MAFCVMAFCVLRYLIFATSLVIRTNCLFQLRAHFGFAKRYLSLQKYTFSAQISTDTNP